MSRRSSPGIDGIGGVFLYADDADRLAAWYRTELGIPLKPLAGGIHYVEIYYRSLARPSKRLHTVFAVFPADRRLGSRRDQSMVNYRVNDLVGFVRRLRRRGVRVDRIHRGPDAEGIGRFTHLRDPEGNRIELWEPSTGA